MDAKWVVQIYANNKHGASCIGTGYAIDDRHILTASHVLFFDGRADNPEFKLVWSEKDGNGEIIIQDKKPIYDVYNKAMFFNEKDIVFNSNIKELDLAVIRCPNALLFKPPKVTLANNLPKTEWKTKGFPRVGKVEDKRNLTGFTVKSEDETGNILSVSISVNPDEDKFGKTEKVWGGLSGAPVFSDNKLIAVITNSHDKLENYFYATSIPWVQQYRKDFCEAIKPAIDEEAIKEQTEKLHEVIKTNIEILLESNFSLNDLRISLRLPNNEKISYNYIAEDLTKQSTIESISALINIVERKSAKDLDDIQEIAGWLLLNSIDSTWWFQNEHKMQETITEFNLEIPEYFETIVSRHALQPARYTLDFNHADKAEQSLQEAPYPKPYKAENKFGNKEKKKILIIDANEKATDEQLLIPIYKDLWERQNIKDDDIKHPKEDLLKFIINKAKAKRTPNQGKLVYYLVNKIYLDLLKSKLWFQDNEQELANCLKFICCDISKLDNQEKPCAVGEGVVLSLLDELLKIIEPVKQNEQSQT